MRATLAITKALADETRLRLLLALDGRELCGCQLIALVGLAPSTVSKHLTVLEHAGLIQSRKVGRWVHCRLPPEDRDPVVTGALAWVRQALADSPVMAQDRARLAAILGCSAEELCRRAKCRLNVLFLCTGNSCRSQMAEGWARYLHGSWLTPYSAGLEPQALDPRAVAVMAEAGVDISGQQPKHVDTVRHLPFELVITVCDHAQESCPRFPGKVRMVHAGFPDPPRLAAAAASEAEALACYRQVRDQIREFVAGLPDQLLSQCETH